MNLDAYLKRIDYLHSLSPDLDTLTRLQEHHTRSIPFENLNPLLGIPVKLDRESLQQKLVNDGRGGYCFENNGFFKMVLEEIGFEVTPLAGRVMWNQPEDIVARKTHMILLVHIHGADYLVDVGFGGYVPTVPLLFKPDLIQQTPHESYRLEKNENVYTLRIRVDEKWRIMYRFKVDPVPQIDYEVANWYTSTCPACFFTTGLDVARADTGYRYTLRDNRFVIRNAEKKKEIRILSSVNELKEVLRSYFKIRLPLADNLDARLNDVLEMAKADAG